MLPKLLLLCILVSSFIFTTHSYNKKCLRHQEILLLQLKDELIFYSSLSTNLVRWNESSECCKWYGVECDASGYVVSLQLDGEGIYGGIGDSSSLFKFNYLQKLNLAYNDLNDPIPKGIGNLTYLTHLNLSNAGFVGQVPSEILSLTRLASLDISDIYGNHPSLEQQNLEMIVQNLSELRELYLDGVNITSSDERRKWSHNISPYLPNLTVLSMEFCYLNGSLPKSFWHLHSLSILRLDYNNLSTLSVHDLFTNFPSLAILSLVDCQLKGSIPSSFANLTKLIHVDLGQNFLSGTLYPTLFKGLSNLTFLNLRQNSFFGNIPHSLFALPSLLVLDLTYNQFNGTFRLDTLRSLANLTTLGLSHNSLSVDVGDVNSSSYGSLQLKVLDLASCNLSNFPDFIKKSDLEQLDLSGNRIAGEIPSWIWGTQLEFLNLSSNLLTDIQKPYHIPPSLIFLYLSYNQLRGELHLPIPAESNLNSLDLANNKLSGSIPTSLLNATRLFSLDFSINNLSGSIPPGLLENINVFDVAQNNINGSIPDIISMDCMLTYLELSHNNLEGKIPKSLERCRSLDFMNVRNNNINDTFPCMLLSTLSFLALRFNRFHGELTCQESWSGLRVLDISSNNFGGRLESINFSTRGAMMLNNLTGTYVSQVDITMKGIDLELLHIRKDIAIIDFSHNNFHGEIPNAIGDLNLLFHLNLSHNALYGSIPKSFGQLKVLESLDLSANQLTGQIPMELGELTFIGVLNLSYNKLVGMIPNGRQIQTFPVESFEGNPGLCGLPLNIRCSPTGDNDNGLSPRGHEEKKEIEWEYVSAALGYVVGVGIIVWLLIFCRRFREKYFGKIEEVVEDIFIARDMRRRRARMVARNRARRQ
ncbi:hypothetical protein SASPL_136848 [Salvia splendens]|uniref:Leucine-rich repeat-containing N-terminal plant-type domain-containing protein n=1 Tax=Salvia splendens TaxID=180675 RepID=A0A8X8X2Q6_SALSN|nr:receptor-like protein 54 [Salvia splendens]KAG6404598.1 hypothetical protein SASPL_136848 [Salvia splendens]